MAIGVPYDIFWVLNPKELEPFKKAFSFSQELIDVQNWQLGNYIRMAISSSLSDKNKYPSKPFLYEKSHEEQLSEEERYSRGKENNQIVSAILMERIRRRKLQSSGGDKLE